MCTEFTLDTLKVPGNLWLDAAFYRCLHLTLTLILQVYLEFAVVTTDFKGRRHYNFQIHFSYQFPFYYH